MRRCSLFLLAFFLLAFLVLGDRPALAHVSVPTTYSGAELTPFFGMTDPATRQKSGAGGPTTALYSCCWTP